MDSNSWQLEEDYGVRKKSWRTIMLMILAYKAGN
jgi:hypothetical protein